MSVSAVAALYENPRRIIERSTSCQKPHCASSAPHEHR
jgi:hypothetical protein